MARPVASGATVQLTLVAVKVVGLVTVMVRAVVVLFNEGEIVPLLTPLITTESPVAYPWGLAVVTVHGFPVLMEVIGRLMKFRMMVLAPAGNCPDINKVFMWSISRDRFWL